MHEAARCGTFPADAAPGPRGVAARLGTHRWVPVYRSSRRHSGPTTNCPRAASKEFSGHVCPFPLRCQWVAGLVEGIAGSLVELPVPGDHLRNRSGNEPGAQMVSLWSLLSNHTYRIDEFNRMDVLELIVGHLKLILLEEPLQHIRRRFADPPMLMVNDVGKLLEEGNRGKRVEKSSFEFLPIAAVHVLGDKNPAVLNERKIARERPCNVAGSMRSIVDDHV